MRWLELFKLEFLEHLIQLWAQALIHFAERYAEEARLQAEMESEQTESLSILLLCDRRLPFKTINHITKTAALAGFPNFQLAVLKR